jgi:hypothetical protein
VFRAQKWPLKTFLGLRSFLEKREENGAFPRARPPTVRARQEVSLCLSTYDDFLRPIRISTVPSLSLTNRAISESAVLVLKDTLSEFSSGRARSRSSVLFWTSYTIRSYGSISLSRFKILFCISLSYPRDSIISHLLSCDSWIRYRHPVYGQLHLGRTTCCDY